MPPGVRRTEGVRWNPTYQYRVFDHLAPSSEFRNRQPLPNENDPYPEDPARDSNPYTFVSPLPGDPATPTVIQPPTQANNAPHYASPSQYGPHRSPPGSAGQRTHPYADSGRPRPSRRASFPIPNHHDEDASTTLRPHPAPIPDPYRGAQPFVQQPARSATPYVLAPGNLPPPPASGTFPIPASQIPRSASQQSFLYLPTMPSAAWPYGPSAPFMPPMLNAATAAQMQRAREMQDPYYWPTEYIKRQTGLPPPPLEPMRSPNNHIPPLPLPLSAFFQPPAAPRTAEGGGWEMPRDTGTMEPEPAAEPRLPRPRRHSTPHLSARVNAENATQTTTYAPTPARPVYTSSPYWSTSTDSDSDSDSDESSGRQSTPPPPVPPRMNDANANTNPFPSGVHPSSNLEDLRHYEAVLITNLRHIAHTELDAWLARRMAANEPAPDVDTAHRELEGAFGMHADEAPPAVLEIYTRRWEQGSRAANVGVGGNSGGAASSGMGAAPPPTPSHPSLGLNLQTHASLDDALDRFRTIEREVAHAELTRRLNAHPQAPPEAVLSDMIQELQEWEYGRRWTPMRSTTSLPNPLPPDAEPETPGRRAHTMTPRPARTLAPAPHPILSVPFSKPSWDVSQPITSVGPAEGPTLREAASLPRQPGRLKIRIAHPNYRAVWGTTSLVVNPGAAALDGIVTVKELLQGIYDHLAVSLTSHEAEHFLQASDQQDGRGRRWNSAVQAFHRRRFLNPEEASAGIRRVDLLGTDTLFVGLLSLSSRASDEPRYELVLGNNERAERDNPYHFAPLRHARDSGWQFA